MEQAQTILKCPFRSTLITRDFGCEYAHEVTHRDGPGIICGQMQSHQRCATLFDTLKQAALPLLDTVDDLNQMPASVISKIQYGGLQGLAQLLGQEPETVANINSLVESAFAKYQNMDGIDISSIAEVIRNCRLRKRRR